MPARRNHLSVANATPATPTFDDDVRRYVDLQAKIGDLTTELEAIRVRIRAHGSGQVGDLVVTVAAARRFSPVRAVDLLSPDELASITETTLSSAKAKQVLPPVIYEQLLYPYGEPRVTVR